MILISVGSVHVTEEPECCAPAGSELFVSVRTWKNLEWPTE